MLPPLIRYPHLPILLLCFLLLPGTCARAQKMLPAAAVPGMLDTIHAEILQRHPFAFAPTGVMALAVARTQVQAKATTELAGRDSLSLIEFKALASPLQEVTGCGHLILSPFYDSLAYRAVRESHFPLHLVRVRDGGYALATGLRTVTDSLAPGSRVTALAGIPLDTFLHRMSPFTGLNDQGNATATRAMVARAPAHYYQAYYGVRDSLTLTVTDSLGRTRQRVITARHRPYVDPKTSRTDINRWLDFRLTEDGTTGLLTIRKFSSYRFYNGDYFRFIRAAFDSLRRAGVGQLVIDIRNNTGGASSRINYLYHFLSDRAFQFSSDSRLTGPAKALPGESGKDARRRRRGAVTRTERKVQKALTKFRKPAKPKNRFTGRVVVLINDVSFSASGMFARFVQGSGRGQLVGTTSGAAAGTTYGGNRNPKRIYLGPDRAFELRVNTISLRLPHPIDGNVTPDVTVHPTVAGLRAGRDEQLEAALELLRPID